MQSRRAYRWPTDYHNPLREGLRSTLTAEAGIQVVAEVHDRQGPLSPCRLGRAPALELASILDHETVAVGRKQAVYDRNGNESAGTTQILSP